MNRIYRQRVEDSAGLAEMNCDYISFDLLPIEVKDAVVKPGTLEMFIPGEMRIQQGQFVALLGPRGGGKATLLRLLGGALLPVMESLEANGGPTRLVIPSHLRVLHVPADPMFFLGSLFDNLTYGVTTGDADKAPERVISICQYLDIPDSIIDLLKASDEEAEKANWTAKFSASELALLNIARAFIANPEILCMHRPTTILDDSTTARVVCLFKDFVEKRGVALDGASMHRRRPRTCMITSNKSESASVADRVYILTRQNGVRILSIEEVEKLTSDPHCMTDSGLEALLEAPQEPAKQKDRLDR
jgi:ABC-type nitrate/sulfonate/bicarbonate transport system ATPase subunit